MDRPLDRPDWRCFSIWVCAEMRALFETFVSVVTLELFADLRFIALRRFGDSLRHKPPHVDHFFRNLGVTAPFGARLGRIQQAVDCAAMPICPLIERVRHCTPQQPPVASTGPMGGP